MKRIVGIVICSMGASMAASVALSKADWLYPNKFRGNCTVKTPSIRYSRRMLVQRSAVDMYLLKRAELYRKLPLVCLFDLFNYAVPEHER